LQASRQTSTLALVFRLRDYQNKDIEKLHRLDQECFEVGISYSRAELTSFIEKKGSFCIVAELEAEWSSEAASATPASKAKPARKYEKGTVTGFIVAERHPKGYGHIITIDVREGFRRHQLGTKLLNAAEDRLRKLDSFMVVLEVAVNNLAAITFYKRHNFNVARTIPRYYKDELDAFFMTKRL
jgi:ribosomal protein S18 acetylase RimI-like enzyme